MLVYADWQVSRCRWGVEVDLAVVLPHAGLEADVQVAPGEVGLHRGPAPEGLHPTGVAGRCWWDDV